MVRTWAPRNTLTKAVTTVKSCGNLGSVLADSTRLQACKETWLSHEWSLCCCKPARPKCEVGWLELTHLKVTSANHRFSCSSASCSERFSRNSYSLPKQTLAYWVMTATTTAATATTTATATSSFFYFSIFIYNITTPSGCFEAFNFVPRAGTKKMSRSSKLLLKL